jgi:hypothetical protein
MEMQSNDNGGDQRRRITRPLATLLAVAVALFRLLPQIFRQLPYLPNFSPFYAMDVFSGARLRSWHAFALPLAIRVLTDVLLLLFQGQMSEPAYYLSFLPFVYLSVICNVLLGRLLMSTESPVRIGGVLLLASAQFYLITNFGTWIGSNMYPHTLTGLIECYVVALPFFRNSTLAYCGFGALLFGAHALLSRTAFPAERVQTAATPETAPIPS